MLLIIKITSQYLWAIRFIYDFIRMSTFWLNLKIVYDSSFFLQKNKYFVITHFETSNIMILEDTKTETNSTSITR